jgi:Flp pilus assembly protein TadG
VVEFALVLPLLMLLLLGMFEFGRVIMVQQVLTNAAREGAREACLLETSDTMVIAAARRFTDSANLTSVTVDITPDDPSTAEAGDEVTVEVAIPITAVSWLSARWFPSGYQVTSAASMRKEGFQ